MLLVLAWLRGGPGVRRAITALVAAVAAGLVMYGVVSTGESSAGHAAAPTAAAPTAKAPTARSPAATAPAAEAARWYARRKGLPASRVRPLQVDRVDRDTVRVLLLVTRQGGGLDSAVVTVRRAGSGWVVPSR
jgi:hypothetical protein